ncbi:MAG: DUF302 domain-containing protein [bacterium]|nr:DUF302 domain-containing protein [bacterium]
MLRFLVVTFALAVSAPFLTLSAWAQEGWIEKSSPHSVADTTAKLKMAVENAGAKVFAVIDHAAGAASIDQELAPTTLIIFGNPKIGTPLIQSNQLVGYDLPIRVLIWEQDGTTRLGYEDPAALAAQYSIEDADAAVTGMTGALNKLTGAAIAE